MADSLPDSQGRGEAGIPTGDVVAEAEATAGLGLIMEMETETARAMKPTAGDSVLAQSSEGKEKEEEEKVVMGLAKEQKSDSKLLLHDRATEEKLSEGAEGRGGEGGVIAVVEGSEVPAERSTRTTVTSGTTVNTDTDKEKEKSEPVQSNINVSNSNIGGSSTSRGLGQSTTTPTREALIGGESVGVSTSEEMKMQAGGCKQLSLSQGYNEAKPGEIAAVCISQSKSTSSSHRSQPTMILDVAVADGKEEAGSEAEVKTEEGGAAKTLLLRGNKDELRSSATPTNNNNNNNSDNNSSSTGNSSSNSSNTSSSESHRRIILVEPSATTTTNIITTTSSSVPVQDQRSLEPESSSSSLSSSLLLALKDTATAPQSQTVSLTATINNTESEMRPDTGVVNRGEERGKEEKEKEKGKEGLLLQEDPMLAEDSEGKEEEKGKEESLVEEKPMVQGENGSGDGKEQERIGLLHEQPQPEPMVVELETSSSQGATTTSADDDVVCSSSSSSGGEEVMVTAAHEIHKALESKTRDGDSMEVDEEEEEDKECTPNENAGQTDISGGTWNDVDFRCVEGMETESLPLIVGTHSLSQQENTSDTCDSTTTKRKKIAAAAAAVSTAAVIEASSSSSISSISSSSSSSVSGGFVVVGSGGGGGGNSSNSSSSTSSSSREGVTVEPLLEATDEHVLKPVTIGSTLQPLEEVQEATSTAQKEAEEAAQFGAADLAIIDSSADEADSIGGIVINNVIGAADGVLDFDVEMETERDLMDISSSAPPHPHLILEEDGEEEEEEEEEHSRPRAAKRRRIDNGPTETEARDEYTVDDVKKVLLKLLPVKNGHGAWDSSKLQEVLMSKGTILLRIHASKESFDAWEAEPEAEDVKTESELNENEKSHNDDKNTETDKEEEEEKKLKKKKNKTTQIVDFTAIMNASKDEDQDSGVSCGSGGEPECDDPLAILPSVFPLEADAEVEAETEIETETEASISNSVQHHYPQPHAFSQRRSTALQPALAPRQPSAFKHLQTAQHDYMKNLEVLGLPQPLEFEEPQGRTADMSGLVTHAATSQGPEACSLLPTPQALSRKPRFFKVCNCGQVLTNRTSYNAHVKKHNEWLTCSQCPFKTKLPDTLRWHMIVHKTNPEMKCILCGQKFSRQENLAMHLKRFHSVYQCRFCGDHWTEMRLYDEHMCKIHLNFGRLPICCVQKYGEEGERLPMTMQTAEATGGVSHQPSTSTSAPKATFSTSNEDNAATSHTGTSGTSALNTNRPLHCCDKCPYTTTSHADLEAHAWKDHCVLPLQSVIDEEEYQDPVPEVKCEVMPLDTVTDEEDSQDPISEVTLKKVFQQPKVAMVECKSRYKECTICTKVFPSSKTLLRHKSIAHRKEFTCSECGFVLKSRPKLARHQKSAHRNKVRCRFRCGALFGTREEQWRHYTEVHNQVPYLPCKYCGKSFLYQGRLDSHMERSHSNASEKDQKPAHVSASCDEVTPAQSGDTQHTSKSIKIEGVASAAETGLQAQEEKTEAEGSQENTMSNTSEGSTREPKDTVGKEDNMKHPDTDDLDLNRGKRMDLSWVPYIKPSSSDIYMTCKLCAGVHLERSFMHHILYCHNEKAKSMMEGPMKCEVCGHFLISPKMFCKHVMKHHSEKNNWEAFVPRDILEVVKVSGYCWICNIRHNDEAHSLQRDRAIKEALVAEELVVAEDFLLGKLLKPFSCDRCSLSLLSRREFWLHAREHLAQLPQGAPLCDDPMPFRCLECQTRYPDRGAFYQHIFKHFTLPDEDEEMAQTVFIKEEAEEGGVGDAESGQGSVIT